MLRKWTFALVLVASLVAARPASAIPVNLDLWLPTAGELFAGPLTDDFAVADDPPPTMGDIENNVYFNDMTGEYTYVHTVNPTLDNNFLLDTAFVVKGYTGVSGWSFDDADDAGGTGTIADFLIAEPFGLLFWFTDPRFISWDANEPISFFFVSTKPPGLGDYNLIGLEAGTANSYAPVPEPGSIALLGSGLVGLYTAMRRRRSLTA